MEKVKLNIQGDSSIPTDRWEEGWDVVSSLSDAINEDILTDGSSIDGKLSIPVAKPSEVAKVNEKFGDVIEVDENMQQFEDKEVLKVISANVGGGNPASKTAFQNLTSVQGWFVNNDKIVTFNEFAETNITILQTSTACGFTNCTNLKEIDLGKLEVQDCWQSKPFGGCTNLEVVVADNLKSFKRETNRTFLASSHNLKCIGRYAHVCHLPKLEDKKIAWHASESSLFGGNSTIYAAFFPKMKYWEGDGLFSTYGGSSPAKCEYWMMGKSLEKVFGGLYDVNGHATKVMTMRCNTPPSVTRKCTGGLRFIFVPSDSVSKYEEDSNWNEGISIIKPIGGTEWQAVMREYAEKYAKECDNHWTDEQIANAYYSDPFIDYDIFGVPRPED